MSSIANLGTAPSAPAAVNIHPHSHKHGSHVQSLDDSDNDSGSDTAAQIPAGTAQNVFGSLLQSLEQVIGVQWSGAAGVGANAASGATAASGAAPAQSANTQNFLSNLVQSRQAG